MFSLKYVAFEVFFNLEWAFRVEEYDEVEEFGWGLLEWVLVRIFLIIV